MSRLSIGCAYNDLIVIYLLGIIIIISIQHVCRKLLNKTLKKRKNESHKLEHISLPYDHVYRNNLPQSSFYNFIFIINSTFLCKYLLFLVQYFFLNFIYFSTVIFIINNDARRTFETVHGRNCR